MAVRLALVLMVAAWGGLPCAWVQCCQESASWPLRVQLPGTRGGCALGGRVCFLAAGQGFSPLTAGE
jgi:hypothetical protein